MFLFFVYSYVLCFRFQLSKDLVKKIKDCSSHAFCWLFKDGAEILGEMENMEPWVAEVHPSLSVRCVLVHR